MERIDVSLPVLILQMQHHGALGVMRSLGRLGVPLYGVHDMSRPPASYSKYCRKVFVLNLDDNPPEQSVDSLLEIARQIGGRAMLVPTNDESAIFVAQNALQLQEDFLFPHNPIEVVWSLYNKKEMYFLAKRLSIPTAETIFPQCREEVVEFADRARFPLMLKAADNIQLARRTGMKMVIVRSKEELIGQYDALEDCCEPSLMIQEFIPGNDDSVWMFNGYFNENSECLFGITGRKIHQTPVYTGMTSLGVCLPNQEVERSTKRLMKAIGYEGIIDIGYRYDPRDSLYKLLDANPRLGATFRLFVDADGMDVIRAQYFHFTGRSIPTSPMCIGRKWILEDADLISCIQYYRDRVLTVSNWASGYKGIREGAWFASDDPKPFIHMCTSFAMRPFRKVAREGRRFMKSAYRRVAVGHADATP
jgi:predicted ATP-grasp superfamily ATP-dependent carboligase